MSKVTEEINTLFPEGLNRVRIAMVGLSEPARKLCISLYDMGATIIASDPDQANVTALSRILMERSGSLYRYKPVMFEGIHREVAEVFVLLTKPVETPTNAKHIISRLPEPSQPGSQGKGE